MRSSSRYAVTGPIPTINRTVVKAKGLQLRSNTFLNALERIFIDLGSQDQSVTGDVFFEYLQDRIIYPMCPKTHSSLRLPKVSWSPSCINRLLKNSNPSFSPEFFQCSFMSTAFFTSFVNSPTLHLQCYKIVCSVKRLVIRNSGIMSSLVGCTLIRVI